MRNVSFGSTTAYICATPEPPENNKNKNQKLKGLVHNRANELVAHKDIIQIASSQMIDAISKKDYEQANQWSKAIDNAQEQIFRIIDQEDKFADQKHQNRTENIKTTVDSTTKITDIGKNFLSPSKYLNYDA